MASQARLRPSANFYPRPPRGGRQYLQYDNSASQKDFYPRPPRGGRPRTRRQKWCCTKFLSTPSTRRATAHCTPALHLFDISIHALREEGDARHLDESGHENVISIHALREEGDRRGESR